MLLQYLPVKISRIAVKRFQRIDLGTVQIGASVRSNHLLYLLIGGYRCGTQADRLGLAIVRAIALPLFIVLVLSS